MIDIGKDLQNAFNDGYKARDSEIVRCKDCIHFHENVFGDEIGLGKPYDNLIVGHNGCGRLAPKGDMIYVSQDGFCFLAEKKWED